MGNFNHTNVQEDLPISNQNRLFAPSIINKAAIFTTLLFIFLVPWGDSIYDGMPRLAATAALGLASLQLLVHGTHRNYSLFHFIVILYFGWQLISMVWTPDIAWAEGVANTSVQLIFLVLLFSLVIDNRMRLIAAYQAYVFAIIVASGIVINSFLSGEESGYLRYGIQNLTIDAVGVFLAIAIPLEAYLAKYYQHKIMKIINLVAIPLTFYAIFLTATRTAFIVGIIGLLYWAFTQRKASLIAKSLIGIGMVVALAAILAIAPKSSVDRILSTGESITEGTLNYRSVIWGGSIEQWKESPITGVGLGGLGYALSKQSVQYRGAHNSFIHILTETGLIGLILFLAMHISLLIFILHSPFEEKAFLLALLMVIMVSQLSTHLQTEKITWFVYTMLAIHSKMLSNIRPKF